MMASIFDVAKYILTKQGTMSAWKLQKLCYYSQAWSLAWSDGVPLFDENFQAWANGPVCKELYNYHRGKYIVSANDLNKGCIDSLTKDEIDSIDTVLNDYGNKEPFWLREQTHDEPPWKIAREDTPSGERSDSIITKESMGSYYGSL